MINNLSKEKLIEKMSELPLWKKDGMIYFPLNYLNSSIIEHASDKDRTPMRNIIMYAIQNHKKYRTVTQEIVYNVPYVKEVLKQHVFVTREIRNNDPVLVNTPQIMRSPRLYISTKVIELSLKGVRNFIDENITKGNVTLDRELEIALSISSRDRSTKKFNHSTFKYMLEIILDEELLEKIYQKSLKFWANFAHQYEIDPEHRTIFRSRYDRAIDYNSVKNVLFNKEIDVKEKFNTLIRNNEKIRKFTNERNEYFYNIKDIFYIFGFSDTTFRKYFKILNPKGLLYYSHRDGYVKGELGTDYHPGPVKVFGRHERHISVNKYYIKENNLRRIFVEESNVEDLNKRIHRRWPKYDMVYNLNEIFDAV